MTLSAMNARRLIKPRLVCECILVVWSAIYLGIAIRFWILLLWSLPLPCFAWSKWSLPQRAWVLRRADLQGEHGSLSFQSSLPHRVLPYSGLEKKKSPTRSKPSKHVENHLFKYILGGNSVPPLVHPWSWGQSCHRDHGLHWTILPLLLQV